MVIVKDKSDSRIQNTCLYIQGTMLKIWLLKDEIETKKNFFICLVGEYMH